MTNVSYISSLFFANESSSKNRKGSAKNHCPSCICMNPVLKQSIHDGVIYKFGNRYF